MAEKSAVSFLSEISFISIMVGFDFGTVTSPARLVLFVLSKPNTLLPASLIAVIKIINLINHTSTVRNQVAIKLPSNHIVIHNDKTKL